MLERLNRIERLFSAPCIEEIERVEAWNNAYVEVCEKEDLTGPYHVWNTGFEQGNATEEEVQKDMRAHGLSWENEDEYWERTEEFFQYLNDRMMAAYEAELEKRVCLECYHVHGQDVTCDEHVKDCLGGGEDEG